MASNASPEANEIRRRGRRRLVGAIALVMLLVVFVPMVLDSEPRPARNEPATRIPPRDNAPPLPTPPPAVAPAKAGAQSAPTAEAPKAATPPPATAVVEPVKPNAEAPEAAQSKPAAAPKTADAAKLQGFAVQVGAFRDEAKLRQSREKLAAAGVVHYTERLDAKGGPLTRLRAGPFATRAEAEAALVKLKRATIDGKVVPLP
jgi:DedD protein